MKSAKKAPMTARRTQRATFEAGVGVSSAGGKAAVAPCSSQGLEARPWRDSHQAPMRASALRNSRMLAMGRPRCGSCGARLVLRQKILVGTGHAVIIGPAIDDGHVLAPIAVRWRRFRRL